ncbi:MAG: tRNA lysidine(34) synthetase TilS [Elusimicrobia bacterium RIFOXYB2_FULL_49_7]|nr:MAG: tRNA lysidine(34) synthetase TilS [Elusimicrobia bacterium RIFOXYB2_FULL_49_7]
MLLAVSGGSDSVAMLSLFVTILAPRFNLSLTVAHFNHGWRGRASDRDEAFVAELAHRFNLRCFSQKQIVRPKKNESPEEAARMARYRFLTALARKQGCTKIATAHHADDQAETVLMRLLSGCGVEGLQAIRAKNGPLIRPLLSLSKADLSAYLRAEKLSHRTDASNRDPHFLRNRIRLHLIPFLTKEFGAHSTAALCRLPENLADQNELVSPAFLDLLKKAVDPLLTGDSLSIKVPAVSALPGTLLKPFLEHLLADFHPVTLSSAHVRDFADKVLNGHHGSAVQLPAGLTIRRVYQTLCFDRPARVHLRSPLFLSFPNKPGTYSSPANQLTLILRIRKKGKVPAFPEANSQSAYLDYDQAAQHKILSLRTRQPGDRFHPLGALGEKKLKDFLINIKLPKAKRGRLPLLAGGCTILWVPGFRISDCYKVTPKTSKILEVKIAI